jgi:hypothetical protein
VYNRVRDGNFSLEGVAPGWDLKDQTVGVLGTGRIGEAFVRIMVGLGCRVLGYDVHENARLAKLQQRTRAVSAGDDDEGGAVGGSFKYASLEEIWPVRLGFVLGLGFWVWGVVWFLVFGLGLGWWGVVPPCVWVCPVCGCECGWLYAQMGGWMGQ